MLASSVQIAAIKEINRQGFDVLQMFQPGQVEPIFFLVYKFDEAYFNTAASVEYNVLEGIEITQFMERNASFAHNVVDFTNNLLRTVEESPVLRVQFSKETVWYKWSLVTETNKVRQSSQR